MSVHPPSSDQSPVSRPKRRTLRDAPVWVWITVAVIASFAIGPGVFATANYIEDRTTVTIDHMAWAFSYAPGATGYLPLCGFGGAESCPYRVHPGSDFAGSVLISGFAGENVTLSAPPPFHLLSTNPSIPTLVPPSGVVISVVLQLPSSAGEYSFTGTLTFT